MWEQCPTPRPPYPPKRLRSSESAPIARTEGVPGSAENDQSASASDEGKVGSKSSSSSSSSSLPGSAESAVTPASPAAAAAVAPTLATAAGGGGEAANSSTEDESETRGVPGDVAGVGGKGEREKVAVEGGGGPGRRRELPLSEREGFSVVSKVLKGRGEGLEMDLEALRVMRSDVNKVRRFFADIRGKRVFFTVGRTIS